MNFANPPVSEVGISVSLAAPSFDSYDIREIHDLFRPQFPICQRVEPTHGSDFDSQIGLPPLSITPVSRWWFVDNTDTNVFQLQENYLSRNWRRVGRVGEPAGYPGYQVIIEDFKRGVEILKGHLTKRGQVLPDIRSCELMYDDIISGIVGGEFMRIGEMVNFLSPPRSIPTFNWQCGWSEILPKSADDTEGVVSVAISAAGIAEAEGAPPHPILRIVWKANASNVGWDSLGAFFDDAHDYIALRFGEIVSDRLKESWDPL